MANTTNVVITIENGTVSIAVLQDEAPAMCLNGAELPCESAPSFKSIFAEEEVCIRFVEDEPFCHGHAGRHGFPAISHPGMSFAF